MRLPADSGELEVGNEGATWGWGRKRGEESCQVIWIEAGFVSKFVLGF